MARLPTLLLTTSTWRKQRDSRRRWNANFEGVVVLNDGPSIREVAEAVFAAWRRR